MKMKLRFSCKDLILKGDFDPMVVLFRCKKIKKIETRNFDPQKTFSDARIRVLLFRRERKKGAKEEFKTEAVREGLTKWGNRGHLCRGRPREVRGPYWMSMMPTWVRGPALLWFPMKRTLNLQRHTHSILSLRRWPISKLESIMRPQKTKKVPARDIF